MAVGPLLQIARILKRRHSGDVSIFYLSIIAAGASIWAAYGVAIGDPPLIIANTVGVLTNVGTIIVVFLYRNGPRGGEDAAGSEA